MQGRRKPGPEQRLPALLDGKGLEEFVGATGIRARRRLGKKEALGALGERLPK